MMGKFGCMMGKVTGDGCVRHEGEQKGVLIV